MKGSIRLTDAHKKNPGDNLQPGFQSIFSVSFEVALSQRSRFELLVEFRMPARERQLAAVYKEVFHLRQYLKRVAGRDDQVR